MILSSRKSIEDESIEDEPVTSANNLLWLVVLGCVTGGDKPKTPDRLSSTKADGADSISLFRQPDLCMMNGKFETACPVGFDNVGQCDRFSNGISGKYGFEQLKSGQ
jgi:hypothetical protein